MIILLQDLRELRLAHNHLTTLPDSFGDFKRLQKIVLSQNILVELPMTFYRLADSALVVLDLTNNDTLLRPTTEQVAKGEIIIISLNHMTEYLSITMLYE